MGCTTSAETKDQITNTNTNTHVPIKIPPKIYDVTNNKFTIMIKVNGQTMPIIKDHLQTSYVALKDGDEFTVHMQNNGSTKCDAELEIDGTVMGKWRLEAHQSVDFERPLGDLRKFTFKKEIATETKSGLVKTDNNGLVKVTFYPETSRYANTASVMSSVKEEIKSQTKINENTLGEYIPRTEIHQGGKTILGQLSSQAPCYYTSALAEVDILRVTPLEIRLVV